MKNDDSGGDTFAYANNYNTFVFTGRNAKDVPSQDEVTNFGQDSSLLGTLKQASQPSSSDNELLPHQLQRDYQVLSDA